jgi:hypothetical protein
MVMVAVCTPSAVTLGASGVRCRCGSRGFNSKEKESVKRGARNEEDCGGRAPTGKINYFRYITFFVYV